MAAANRCLWRGFRTSVIPLFRLQRHASYQKTIVTAGSAFKAKIHRIIKTYEDVIGQTAVEEAQEYVYKAEKEFLEAQKKRAGKRQTLVELQSQLRDVRKQREEAKGDEMLYLNLVALEHSIIHEEQALEEQIINIELLEKDKFGVLSLAVRKSYEKERIRAKRSKYWSILSSILGATIGIMGTSTSNYFHMRQLQIMVEDSTNKGNEFHEMATDLADTTKSKLNRLEEILNELRSMLESSGQTDQERESVAVLARQTREILDVVGDVSG